MEERVKSVVRTLQSCFSEREDESDRNYYFVAVSAALLALQNPLGEANNNNDKNKTFPHVRALLLQCALFFNSGRDEEENESTLTATEGILHPDGQSHFFPIEFSHCYPPTVRLSSTARALVLSTILYCCRQDDQLLLSLSKELLEMNDTPYTVYDEEESVLFSSNVIVKEPCMPNSHTHRGRLRLWQLLCALQPMLFVEKENMQMHETELSQLFTTLLDRCMTINNSGSVRHFMELYGIRFLKEMPQFYVLLSERLKNYNLRPQVCGSYVLIAAHAILQYEERQVEELTNK
ncbi:hypothetical protein ADEAN_000358000 [Angomonas deanei]|uniref:Uncharacterized protein n=1 Tax=Angomonas deanei TaxID=59799 RepID=A0A7G2C994_9TRYP|nr:hypothetical protein ADEAN_000358000 [Angomonas deanei]